MQKSVYTRAYQRLLQELLAQRQAAALTQQDLAEKLGKPQSFVSKFERGERRLDVVEFLDVCRALEADALAILEKVASDFHERGTGRRRP